jgi:hypothetical protein
MFFVDDEGYLDYQRLVNEVDAAIRAGKMSFLDGVDKRKSTFIEITNLIHNSSTRNRSVTTR